MTVIKSGDSGEVANVTKDKQLMTASVSERLIPGLRHTQLLAGKK